MAQLSLSEYIATLQLDPYTVNTGDWWARSTIHHNGQIYKAGTKLPELKNGEVAQLLEVNTLTSVDPNPPAGEPKQLTPEEEEQAAAAAAEKAARENGPGGTTQLDENGNPIQ